VPAFEDNHKFFGLGLNRLIVKPVLHKLIDPDKLVNLAAGCPHSRKQVARAHAAKLAFWIRRDLFITDPAGMSTGAEPCADGCAADRHKMGGRAGPAIAIVSFETAQAMLIEQPALTFDQGAQQFFEDSLDTGRQLLATLQGGFDQSLNFFIVSSPFE